MIRPLLAAALALAAAPGAVAPTPAAAQAPVLVPNTRDAASTPAPNILAVPAGSPKQKLTMPVGKSIIVDLPSDAAEVFVGKPEVANATVRTTRRLYIMALAKGPTTIFALGKDGRPIATLEINVNDRDIGALSAILKTVLPEDDIRVQAVDDSVILTGTVASAVDAQRAQDIAAAFTGYTALGSGSTAAAGGAGGGVAVSAGTPITVPGYLINSLVIRGLDQVMLKVSIVEIRRDVVKQLGVDLSGAWSGAALATPGGAAANTLASVGSSGLLANLSNRRNTLGATISAFESNGVAHILAEPNVTAVSGETAKLQAGGTIPILQSSTPATGLTFYPVCNYIQQQYGVSLNFTPTVLSGGRISLHVSTQVVEPDASTSVQAPGCGTIVGFRQRQNETTVELPSGGSIVSAGLVQQSSQQTLTGTPGLFDLPILGALFRSRQYQRNESELMIVVTPYIARTLRPDQVSKPDDGFTDASDPQAVLLGRVNRVYSRDGTSAPPAYRGRVGFIND